VAILRIRKYPDPVLRKGALPVDRLTDEVAKLSGDMLETMYGARGIGLAANQVGVPLRLIVLHLQTKKGDEPLVLLNPFIAESDAEEISEEGCLSFPGYYEYVPRAGRILVKGLDSKERPFSMECEGHLARAFQHEIDHLNGVLFIDHLSPVKRSLFKKRFAKSET
jgi:peptide deformylase